MLNNRKYSRTFFNAPQSVAAFIAAFLEPVLTLAVYFAVMVWHKEPILRSSHLLALFVFTLSFPGFNRFGQTALEAALDILGAWFSMLFLLALFGIATSSLHFFDLNVLMWWILLTPVAQWAAVVLGTWLIKIAANRPGAKRKVVVIGAGPLAWKVAQTFKEDAAMQLSHEFIGFFDDRRDARVEPQALQHHLGGLEDVARYINANGVNEVYITMPLGSQPRIVRLLHAVQGTTASLFFVPDILGISVIQGRFQELNGMPVVGICETPFTGTNQLVKRVSDIVLALLILLVASPILLLLAIGVKLSSPGPIIYKQKRNGLDGEEIVIYKFRSMRMSHETARVQQATKGDPRVTPFGAFMRKQSLDELPQFINVIQGNMSIVGPRPHAVSHNEEYRNLIRTFMIRHKVKPGITGWAQINGCRGETDSVEKMQARVEYDLEYLRNWSLGFDLQIIIKTIRLVFFDRNAY